MKPMRGNRATPGSAPQSARSFRSTKCGKPTLRLQAKTCRPRGVHQKCGEGGVTMMRLTRMLVALRGALA